MSTTGTGSTRLGVVLRDGERVSPLELFFDLVFVLAITQCTALMAHDPTWSGIGRGLVVLGLLWWAWVGYSWLTSVVDPDEGGVRLALFGAMACLLVASLAVPHAFTDLGLTLAVAYGGVRAAHIVLFVLASRGDPGLRHSVVGLAVSTAIGVGILLAGSQLHGEARLAAWAAALVFDMAGPLFIDTSGWRLVPGHFAERHGLITLVALGESIVAIGAGAESSLTWGIAAAAVVGIALAAAQWWMYFDVVALVSVRRLVQSTEGQERNELARDSYSYIHFLMVAGIILVALALKKTLAHVEDPLEIETAFALMGGVAIFLLGLVAFRYRHVQTINRRRLAYALILLAAFPAGTEVPALAMVALVTAGLCAIIAYETRGYGERRRQLRQEMAH
jgi:low temperature requirement protein LtrA